VKFVLINFAELVVMWTMIVAMVKHAKTKDVTARKDLSAHHKDVGISTNVKMEKYAHLVCSAPTSPVPLNVSAHPVQMAMPKLGVPSPINVLMMPYARTTWLVF
jgi:hypothetical protein